MVRGDLEQRALVAEKVVREAGRLARKYYFARGGLEVEKKGLQDLVSNADRECEELVVTSLISEFPSDAFVGEEGGRRGDGAALWVIDPIDGTSNFLVGIAHWCVSLGLVLENRAALGFIYDPLADEMFSAIEGGGARLNGAPISVSGQRDLSRARMGLGFSYRRPAALHAADVQKLLDAGCEYLRMGSGALGMAFTAAGRLDGYWERHINLWDVAAGLAIVAEAGGTLSPFLNAQSMVEGNEILATSPALFEPLRALLDWPAANS